MVEAIFDPPWKPAILHYAHGVEVVVAPVLRSRRRVKGDGVVQPELADDDPLDSLWLGHRAPLPFQVLHQLCQRLRSIQLS